MNGDAIACRWAAGRISRRRHGQCWRMASTEKRRPGSVMGVGIGSPRLLAGGPVAGSGCTVLPRSGVGATLPLRRLARQRVIGPHRRRRTEICRCHCWPRQACVKEAGRVHPAAASAALGPAPRCLDVVDDGRRRLRRIARFPSLLLHALVNHWKTVGSDSAARAARPLSPPG